MGYDILHHTADVKFRATGKTLKDAFKEAVNAFSAVAGDGENGSIKYEVDIESENLEALLFDFMDRLIFLQDTNNVAVGRAENMRIDALEDKCGYRLQANIYVDKIVPGGDYLDIKGPTYNEMSITHEDHEWVIEAVLDI